MSRRTGITNIEILAGVLVALAIVVAIVALALLDTTGEKGSGLGTEFIYDIEDLAKIDPNLILYEEAAKAISTGFKSALAIAVDFDGRICVAGDKAIRIFADNGDLVGEIKLAGSPRCLTVTDDGKFYIGMKDHVEVYDGQGKPLAAWQSLGDDAVLTSIAVSKNDVFVADAGNRIVIHYDTDGKLINRIGAKDKDKNIPGFVVPSPYFDLAVARDGLLRVTNPGNHRIEAYTFEGDLEFSWGKFSSNVVSFCGCCNPVNFAILRGSRSAGTDDSFVTCEKGLTRVKIYDVEGAFVGVVAGPEQLVEGGTARIDEWASEGKAIGFDVAVDAAGRIFVLDTIKNVVRIFTKIKAGQ
jgi:hypothetical protein